MFELIIAWEWIEFAVRWLHVITGIAWIGSSFYFIALDLGLKSVPNMPTGVHGEEWQVHGGGFYHIQKYMVAPSHMPEHLTWFKWESYMTWLSGFAMLAILYYVSADLYLIDSNVLEISQTTAILISIFSLGIGWVAYDLLCKVTVNKNSTLLMVLLFIILVAVAWGYAQVFSGRAAMLHVGAFTATIMSANVFFIIIPNQKIVVADLKSGRTPDAKYGIIAKQRSTHNNYLTLPVLFLMLSNHYPLSFATEFNWVIASLIFLMGVTIRHFFNTMHAGEGKPMWTWIATALIFGLIVLISSVSTPVESETEVSESSGEFQLSAKNQRFVDSAHFENIRDVVLGRCSMCHAAEPFWEGVHWAPKNILLESDGQIATQARSIYMHAGRTTSMPPSNLTFMEPEERMLVVAWYESVVGGQH